MNKVIISFGQFLSFADEFAVAPLARGRGLK